jgi:tRNA(Glu) U13 pseudouridine synthase TruD
MIRMDFEDFKLEVMESMDNAITRGDGNASVATAFYLEAIAKMMFFRLFNERYEFTDVNEVVVGDLNPSEEEDSEDETS